MAQKMESDSSEDYFCWLVEHGTSPNGVFGMEIIWEQMGYCIQFLRRLPQYQNSPISPPRLLANLFPNLFYIWMTRRDNIRQAVSGDIAIQTEDYVSTVLKPGPSSKLTFNFNRIDFLYYRILAAEDAWHRYFIQSGVKPFRVVYEEFIANYDETVGSILDYLRIRIPANHSFARPKLKKMANDTNEEWVQRYNEMKTGEAQDGNGIHRRLARWLTSA